MLIVVSKFLQILSYFVSTFFSVDKTHKAIPAPSENGILYFWSVYYRIFMNKYNIINFYPNS